VVPARRLAVEGIGHYVFEQTGLHQFAHAGRATSNEIAERKRIKIRAKIKIRNMPPDSGKKSSK
jgi:hypothetical protein